MPESNVRFVQFPHPGTEHYPDDGARKRWHGVERPHARKFLALRGTWLENDVTRSGSLWAWGEWEPESVAAHELERPTQQHPRWLWEPFFVRKQGYAGLHNTDPFIFDGFYYTNCRQSATGGLRRLDRGSVILFGTGQGHGWVVDTVFVVADFIDHDVESFRAVLGGRVPHPYLDITLRPTWDDPGNATEQFRLYRGATFETPVNGMFSFFPCRPAGGIVGFPRPVVELPGDYFNPRNRQAAKGAAVGGGSHDGGVIAALWAAVRDQVLDAGTFLGLRAEMPREQSEVTGRGGERG